MCAVGSSRTRSPFDKMAIDPFRTNDAANTISGFQDEVSHQAFAVGTHMRAR